MEKERQAYVLTRYEGNLEGQIGVFTDIENLKKRMYEMFMEQLGKTLKDMGASATAKEIMEVAREDEFSYNYDDGYLYFWYQKHPNGVSCRINDNWELNVDTLPLLDGEVTATEEKPRLTSAWVRLGTIIDFTEDELKTMADEGVVCFGKIMREGRCRVDGNSYVPETTLYWGNDNDRHFCESVGMNGDNEINDFEINFEPWQPWQ